MENHTDFLETFEDYLKYEKYNAEIDDINYYGTIKNALKQLGLSKESTGTKILTYIICDLCFARELIDEEIYTSIFSNEDKTLADFNLDNYNAAIYKKLLYIDESLTQLVVSSMSINNENVTTENACKFMVDSINEAKNQVPIFEKLSLNYFIYPIITEYTKIGAKYVKTSK